MNICDSNTAVSLEVKNFILNVHDVKEESITDYLAWKWRELDKRFNYLSMHTFNHDEESTTTGADFDLELWLVGRRKHVTLAVQAKKFINQYASYVRKLRYPEGTKQQMDALLTYAASKGHLPFYFIYSAPDSTFTTLCSAGSTDGGIFMADAKVMEQFADGKRGKRISRDELLAECNPFHCLFCCPLGATEKYLQKYFAESARSAPARTNDELPQYVQSLLLGKTVQKSSHDINSHNNDGWERFKAVGVYDLRNDD